MATLEAETGCRVRWHPLNSADLLAMRGRDPFAGDPVSGQYEWIYRRHDAERWADYYGVPYREPEALPEDRRIPARACLAAKRFGALVEYTHQLYRAIFVDGKGIDIVICADMAEGLGLPRSEFARLQTDPAIDAELTTTTEDAYRRGAFGVPTFFADGRMFWGNDRILLLRHYLRKHG
jgi:2-hydroxychromene-2-carboxylate isomerase